ncbi:MAG: helix-turn-helix transcriptional regulator, partial [Armatimonadota bacterium]
RIVYDIRNANFGGCPMNLAAAEETRLSLLRTLAELIAISARNTRLTVEHLEGVSAALVEYRGLAGMSREVFAALAGVNAQTIWRWEKEMLPLAPSRELVRLRNLVKALETPVTPAAPVAHLSLGMSREEYQAMQASELFNEEGEPTYDIWAIGPGFMPSLPQSMPDVAAAIARRVAQGCRYNIIWLLDLTDSTLLMNVPDYFDMVSAALKGELNESNREPGKVTHYATSILTPIGYGGSPSVATENEQASDYLRTRLDDNMRSYRRLKERCDNDEHHQVIDYRPAEGVDLQIGLLMHHNPFGYISLFRPRAGSGKPLFAVFNFRFAESPHSDQVVPVWHFVDGRQAFELSGVICRLEAMFEAPLPS